MKSIVIDPEKTLKRKFINTIYNKKDSWTRVLNHL